MTRRTIEEVYEAVGTLSKDVHKALADHETRIVVLENRESRITKLEDQNEKQHSEGKAANFSGRIGLLENHSVTDRSLLKELQACFQNERISQAKMLGISSLVASVITAAALIIVALIR